SDIHPLSLHDALPISSLPRRRWKRSIVSPPKRSSAVKSKRRSEAATATPAADHFRSASRASQAATPMTRMRIPAREKSRISAARSEEHTSELQSPDHL